MIMCSRSVSKNWGFLVQYAPFALPVVLSACPLHTLTPEINSSSDRAKQKNMAENHFYNYTIVKGFQDLNLPLLFNKMYSIIVQKKKCRLMLGSVLRGDKQLHVQAWLGIVPYFCFWNGSAKPSSFWHHSGSDLSFAYASYLCID